MQKKRPSVILIITLAIVAICIISSVIVSLVSPSTPTEPATVSISSTPVRSQTPTTSPSQTSLPSPTPAAAPGIPGLTPADLKVNLTDRGFTCTNAKENQVEGLGKWYSWTCDREEGDLVSMHVEIMSRSLSSVDYIDATILQYSDPTDEAASLFLGYIATAAFIGNEEAQTEARSWVEEKLGQLQGSCMEETIHGIPFSLCGPPTARFIEIGKMN